MAFSANWRKIASRLESEFQCLIYDQRGHGRSFKPETGYTPEVFAEDLYKITNELGWDRFHLVQNFNNLINDERKSEAERVKGREHYKDLLNGKNKWIFLKKAHNRSKKEVTHINEVMYLNDKMAKLEIIKERFHQMFDCMNRDEAEVILYEIYQWSCDIEAWPLAKYCLSLRESKSFWNYFSHRFTTSVVEGINRGIKTLKWVAYGYKDMAYFSLKIMQKFGYLNHKYALKWLNPQTE